ncbi:hypothetical protein ACSAZL_21980 [Methanosarcina sp. T3]|uniref:hypothetical protein n=1 Tax=Methanosarcina sp. T3 TaxID=3439062 RepID=UPI003F833EE4
MEEYPEVQKPEHLFEPLKPQTILSCEQLEKRDYFSNFQHIEQNLTFLRKRQAQKETSGRLLNISCVAGERKNIIVGPTGSGKSTVGYEKTRKIIT